MLLSEMPCQTHSTGCGIFRLQENSHPYPTDDRSPCLERICKHTFAIQQIIQPGRRSAATTPNKYYMTSGNNKSFIHYMQRCQSGRSCSLGTAVYGSVPRVRIPVSAPNATKFEFSDFIFFAERDSADFCLPTIVLL